MSDSDVAVEEIARLGGVNPNWPHCDGDGWPRLGWTEVPTGRGLG